MMTRKPLIHVHGEIHLIETGKKLLHLLDRYTETTEEMVGRELKKRKIQPPPETKAAPEPKIPVKLTPAEYALIRLLRRADTEDVSRETRPKSSAPPEYVAPKAKYDVPRNEIPSTIKRYPGLGGL